MGQTGLLPEEDYDKDYDKDYETALLLRETRVPPLLPQRKSLHMTLFSSAPTPARLHSALILVAVLASRNAIGEVQTAPDPKPFTWIAVADHFDEPAAGLVKRMLDAKPSFVVGVGDIIYESRPRDHRALKRLLLDPLKGIGSKFYPVVGNHDFPVKPNWFELWEPPGNQLYYSFDHGNSHFIVLDTNRAEAPDGKTFPEGSERDHMQKQGADYRPGSKQHSWLKKDLEQTKKTHVFVFFHVPAVSFGGHWGKPEIQQALCPLFEEHNVTAVFQSHSHGYERFVPLRLDRASGKPVRDEAEGVTYVVTGGGGMKLADIRKHETHAAASKEFHFVRIAVNGDEAECAAIRASDGKVLDSFELKSRRATSPAGAPAQPAPAEQGTQAFDLARHWSLSTAEQHNTATRKKVCLNGFWQFSPLKGEGTEPEGEWLLLKVPGGFHRNFFFYRQDLQPLRSSEMERIQEETEHALYRRTFELGEAFRNQRVFLEFEFIMDRATVYVNGRQVKAINPAESMEDRQLEITGQMKLPGTNEVKVLVKCRKGQAWRRQAGINGNVWLLAEPAGPRIEDLSISTSVRQRELRIEFALAGEAGQPLSLEGEVREHVIAGAQEGKKAFSIARRPVEERTARLATDLKPHWDNIQLWNFENPRLYDLVLDLRRGDEVVDQVVTRIGFCETWVDGPDFYWNGKILHRRRVYRVIEQWAGRYDQRADPRYFRDFIRQYKRAGFNDFSTTGGGTYVAQMEDFLRVCDEEGVLVWAPILLNHRAALRNENGARDEALKRIQAAIRRYRNHPCVAAWGAWGPIGFTPDENTRNPNNWVPGFKAVMNGAKDIREFYRESYDAMKKADGTRPVVFQSLNSYGDAIASFLYPCFGTPIQEVESWPRRWRAAKDRKPFWVLESDFYYSEAWYRMRQSPRENLVYQHAARTRGPRAYFMGAADDPEPGVIEGSRSVCKHDTKVGGLVVHDHVPDAYLRTRADATVRAVRAWRAFGFATFGLGDDFHNMYDVFKVTSEIPVHQKHHVQHERLKTRGPYVDYQMYAEEFANLLKPELPKLASPSPVFERLRDEALAPFIAFIAHKGTRFEDFTRKDHAYRAGETIEKQVVLINDHADSREVAVTVAFGEAGVKGTKVLTETLEMGSGEIRFVPFSVEAPEGPSGSMAGYELRLAATIKDGTIARTENNPCAEINASWPKTRSDRFAIQVFGPLGNEIPTPHLKVGLYDEVGRTREFLTQAGLAFADLSKADGLAGVNLIIIGRESMTASCQDRLRKLGAMERIAAGDADLLIFEQTRESAPGLSPDLDDVSVRDCFPVEASHPVLSGLDGADFRDWRGESDLLPSMPLYRFFWMPGTKRFQKWTNEGVVSSVMLRKPHYGNFRPLLDGDFDLWETPLLEWLYGKGRIIFCQLDVTNARGATDPVAKRVLRNLFGYFDSRSSGAKPDPFKPTYLLGKDRRLLDVRGVKYQPFQDQSLGTLVICGASKAEVLRNTKVVRAFVRRGGDVLYLVDSADSFAAELFPVQVEPAPRKASRYKLFPGREVLRGLSQGDLFFKTMPELLTFSGECEPLTGPGLVSQVQYGKGRFIVMPRINPDQFAQKWAAAKVARLNSVVLTNLGVRQAGIDLLGAEPRGRAKALRWDFEDRLGAWVGGSLSEEKAQSGVSSVKLKPTDKEVWNRASIELRKPDGICTLAADSFFSFAGHAAEAVFIIITLKGDDFLREYEYQCGAREWTTVAMPISQFPKAKGSFAGKKLTSIRIRWGGPEDMSVHYDVYLDDIAIGPAPKSIFSRYDRAPTYDPNYYTTW